MRFRGSEGRSESVSYKVVVYLILIVGAIPLVLPFYWLLLASLKTRDRVEAFPPDWLPVVPKAFVKVDERDVRVNILDDGSNSGTHVQRFKILTKQERPPTIPAGQLQRIVRTVAFADFGDRRVRVKPLREIDAETLEVQLLAEVATAEVAANSIETSQRTETFWTILGTEIPVTPQIAEIPVEGEIVITAAGPHDPIAVAKVLPGADGAPDVELLTYDQQKRAHFRLPSGRELPVTVVDTNPVAGYALVKLRVPEDGVAVDVAELRQQTRLQTTALVGSDRVPVKVIRVNDQTQRAAVELPGRPVHRVVASSAVTTSEAEIYEGTLLGQRVAVLPDEDVPEGDPHAPVTVQVLGDMLVAPGDGRTHSVAPIRPQWHNFVVAWREQNFDLYLANTLLIASMVVLGTVLSCGLVGYAFARLQFRGSNVLFLILLSTMMIPGQVTSIPTFVLFASIGWIDSFLPLIVPHWLGFAAFFVFLYRQFMMTIPVDLEDSARIDGCGPLATWWLIMMPLSKPIIVTVAVFSFIASWNDFLGPLLYINSDEKQTIALGLQNFKSGFQYAEPQMLMAAAVMMLIPTIIIFFLAQKAFMRGVVVSGVKG